MENVENLVKGLQTLTFLDIQIKVDGETNKKIVQIVRETGDEEESHI